MKRFIILSGLLVSLGWLPVNGQVAKHGNRLEAIPLKLRSGLEDRLNLYVKLMRSQDYVRWYELISDANFRGRSRPSQTEILTYQHKAKSSGYKLIRFNPTSSIFEEDIGAYKIYGQAKQKTKAGITNRELLIYAWLQNGEWYFSELLEELLETFGGVPEPIKVEAPKIIERLPPQ
jgi:hypothetical protein